jgi:hypothetical protein
MIMALLLDLANIVGGFLLAMALLRQLPHVGEGLGRVAARLSAYGWIVGIVGLVAGGYYFLVHVISGPHLFHFEVVGIAVAVALLWDRLTGKEPPTRQQPGAQQAGAEQARAQQAGAEQARAQRAGQEKAEPGRVAATGVTLLLAVFGVIAMIVGVQGLLTPDS